MFHVKQFLNSVIKRPIHEVLFYFFIFFIPFQTRIIYHPDQAYIGWYFNYHLAFFLYFTDIILLSCLVSWMFDKQRENIRGKRIFWLILAFFGLILLSLFHVKRIDIGWYQTFKWGELLFLLLYISETFTEKAHYILSAGILFASAMFQAIVGLIQFHVQHSLKLSLLGEYIAPIGTPGLATIETPIGKIVRAYGTFPHPNILAAFLVFGLILGLFLVSRGTKWIRAIVIPGLFIIGLGLFVTFSRLSWLVAAFAIICFTIYYIMKQKRGLAVAILVPIIVSCVTVLIFAPDTLKARVTDNNSASVTDRYFFNRLGLDLMKRFPVLGLGVGNYVEGLRDLNDLEAWQYQPAHNIFIFIGAELGIAGLGLFIMILFEVFSRLKNVPRETLTFTFALLGSIFLLMGQFDHYFVTIQQGRLMFFIALGMIAALPNLYAQKSDQKIYS